MTGLKGPGHSDHGQIDRGQNVRTPEKAGPRAQSQSLKIIHDREMSAFLNRPVKHVRHLRQGTITYGYSIILTSGLYYFVLCKQTQGLLPLPVMD
jgi:hypothetical protein